ncbi:MAG TPA: PstS family phosphate ABC transporter substrate-binding protein [Saprospiraceae bacterium]|nr:PstS family phosphate ABC transporter substrate-binding protein [Saprospiraceae bacterium]
MKSKVFISIIISAAIFIMSCGKKTSEDGNNNNADSTQLKGSVNIDGSSTVYPITEAVAEEFRKVQPDVKVTVALSGTGGGFKKFGRGETDINDASRPIKEAEDDLATAHNVSYVGLMVCYDGMAVVVNPKNDWCDDMTVAELKILWAPEAQGKIKKWNQIRKEWPNEEIHLYGAGVESGTYDYFTEVITGTSHSSRGDYTASEDDNVLVQGIASDKYALGFFGLAYYEENMDKLKVIGIDDGKDENGAGPILPTLETVKNKSYAPLGRPLFIYVNSTAGKRKEVQEFVRFYLENTSTLSKEVGYIPMSDAETAAEKAKWEDFIKSLAGVQ